ncbi:hypothetical protein N5U17_08490 [Aliarcobacter butzleri]|uniref:Periplasmic protein n=1 Tax=Aliarcobacter butzleri L355 TaxID=1447263 RepID=A0A0G9KVD8_9BACT|nr:hypothetical protein [Aliarcobacter butzleri]KLE06924.1 hypothetical protein AF78_02225 [Aliarcobacter butzleri L353]KLE10582.1 hypothetical protein AF80_03640 [Aliarcobacter butzleri L355]MCG3660956.1 hypothetical protein [Aliarcobacter butzleri]MCT7604271.1 hypothetical protein [Aliarcobacter butzleri]MDN5043070.1 hypothetical protein [Aliarcobacter butzleri]
MKQLLTLLFVAFVFLGCNQKQVVQLKMPNQNKSVPTKVKEDKTTVVEEFISNDSIIKEEVIDNSNNGSMNTVQPQADEETVAQQSININIDETRANVKLAFVYPSTLVSKYAKSSLSTISGYLSYKQANYNLIVVDSKNESYENINNAFSKLKEEGVTDVIALFTPNALNNLNKIVTDDFKVYLPLIEKKDSLENNDNLIFGSISYDDQLKKLSYYSNGKNSTFYQETYLGTKLKNSYDFVIGNSNLRKEISNDEKNFKNIVNDSRLRNSSLFLNTDLVKSSLILSQMTVYEINPNTILATQILFDPMLMVLTQERDRQNLIIANSIGDVDSKLKDEIATVGGNITFEWVDYSTLVGTNYLFSNGNSSLISTKIENNQAVYTPRLFKSTDIGFLEIK